MTEFEKQRTMKRNEDFVISNLTGLDIALMENNTPAVEAYLERMDRETSNDAFRMMGEHFGFPTVEIQGVIWATGTDLARVLGYRNAHGLTQLLDRWGISGIRMGGFTHDVCIQLKQGLSLDPDDNRTILFQYPAILIGGMQSTNEQAKPVKLYMMRCEYLARVGVVALRRGVPPLNALPDAAHAKVKAKLAHDAYRGNPIAVYILETDYQIPVRELLGQTEPELSETVGLIDQYLHHVHDDRLENEELIIEDTETGYYIEGITTGLYMAFLQVARRHGLKIFFSHVNQLGTILSRERDALEILGWTRNMQAKRQGYRKWRYTYHRQQALQAVD